MFPNWLTDLQIEAAPVLPALDSATARGVLWQAAPTRFLLNAPDVARYLAEDGHRLTIERSSVADEEEVIRLGRTAPLAALLYQRGKFAFHAAAAVPSRRMSSRADFAKQSHITDGAVLLAGDSGTGKSTLLAALLQRGWKILSDELAAVGLDEAGQPVIFPVSSEILLYEDALKKFDLQNLRELKPLANGRHAFSALGQFINTPLPLSSIYRLTVRNDGEIETEQIRGQEYFQVINMLLYNSHVADVLLERVLHFRLASALVHSATLRRLTRPRGQWCVEELADRIEADLPLG
jgi:hypothetical protein